MSIRDGIPIMNTGEAVYDGEHSLDFYSSDPPNHNEGTHYRNTWTNWRLIPSSKPIVANPAAKTNFIEIPGRNGALDQTDYLAGKVTYGPRTGSWDFILDNGWVHTWEEFRKMIIEFLHGKVLTVVLTDVPDVYWKGRFTVNSFTAGANNNTVSIGYTLDPYCYWIASVSGSHSAGDRCSL